MKISNNFSYKEVLKNEQPAMEIILNISHLINSIMQPVRDKFGRIVITSGYRSPEYNRNVGGVKNSSHIYGNAVDFIVPNVELKEVYKYIVENFEYDKIIYSINLDVNAEWIHLASKINRKSNRGKALIEKISSGKKEFTHYKKGGVI